MTLFYVIFAVSSGLLLLANILSVFLCGALGRAAGYVGCVLNAVLFLSASYIWRSLEVSLLVILSSLFIYLLISLIALLLKKRGAKGGEGSV
jgi:hypothetical protein